MKTKTKQDYQGNKVVLSGKKLYFYKNDKVFKITEHLSELSALQEFNTITMSYRGCGEGNTRRKREVATVYYNQLIIRL
jgi:hypothetical protein